MGDLAVAPEALSRNLAYLQIDLTDPEFRAHLLAYARATRREIEALLRAAVAAGEVKQDVAARRLARTVETVIGGSLMTWACYREGSAGAWMRRDLDAVLQAYVTPARQSLPSSSRRPRARPNR
jgi:hypothetical protein